MATTIELNQRIVFAGLARMSDDRNMIKSAFSHWHDKYSTVPLDVFEVVAELVEYLGLGVNEKKGLMIGLHSASSRLYDDLKPVPPYILPQQNTSLSADESAAEEEGLDSLPAHLQVTARYLQLVSQYIKRADASTHRELVKAVADEGLSSMPDVVANWASDGLNAIQFDPTVSVEECQDLAHQMYVLVCDFLGPVESDIIVNKAITELSSLAASQDFSATRLL